MQLSPALKIGVLITAVSLCLQGQNTESKDAPIEAKGMPPRAAPADYQAHAQAGAVTVAAEFIAELRCLAGYELSRRLKHPLEPVIGVERLPNAPTAPAHRFRRQERAAGAGATVTGLLWSETGVRVRDVPALAAKASALGVEIREFEKVYGFIRRGGRVCGVKTGHGELDADVVISTVYSWTSALLEEVDASLPVKCFVHQRYVTKPLATPAGIPAVNANPAGIYFRPALGGRLLGGIETPEREEYPVTSLDFHQSALHADPELRNHLRHRLVRQPKLAGDS